MITASDLDAGDDELARRVLAHAKVFAPCLPILEGEARTDALAILRGVAREARARGVRSVSSQGVGTARVAYGSASSWFTQDDREALQAICGSGGPPVTRASAGHPIGVFPPPSRALRRVWPEET